MKVILTKSNPSGEESNHAHSSPSSGTRRALEPRGGRESAVASGGGDSLLYRYSRWPRSRLRPRHGELPARLQDAHHGRIHDPGGWLAAAVPGRPPQPDEP